MTDDELYGLLPSIDDCYRMTVWVDCPVHHLKVGMAADGSVVGRCAECANEAAQALAVITTHTLEAAA